jgi:four helix bundle protein
MSIQSFRDLDVWQRAMDLAAHVYEATQSFPKAEVYGLAGQMRRCAVRVPSNIAEGRGRQSTPDFLKFLSIAYGSLAELQTQIELSERLRYITSDANEGLQERTNEVGRMLNGLMNSLRRRDPRALTPDP